RRLMQQWPQLERSHLLKIGVVRIQALQLRGSTACVVADIMFTRGDETEHERLLREAADCAARLESEAIARCAPTSDMISASIALSRGQRETALTLLKRAEAAFDEQGLAMFAAASRVRVGETTGGEDSERIVLAALSEFTREG